MTNAVLGEKKEIIGDREHGRGLYGRYRVSVYGLLVKAVKGEGDNDNITRSRCKKRRRPDSFSNP